MHVVYSILVQGLVLTSKLYEGRLYIEESDNAGSAVCKR